ncbi:MAG: DUF3267 domain-containing protein [Anaerolineae bacterium]|nr:DUF3267 domain-containing protein [Anaerolineae bacterium]
MPKPTATPPTKPTIDPRQPSPPAGYELAKTIVFTRDNPNYLWVNILMALLLLVFYQLFSNLTVTLVPGFEGAWLGGFSGWGVLLVFLMAFVMMFLHESIHYLGMWVLSGVRPRFTAKSFNPRAVLAQTWFPPLVYIAMKLTPLVLLTAVYFLIAPYLPLDWLDYVIFFFAGNAAYAAQDLLSVAGVLRVPGKKLVEDRSEVVFIYTAR